jgi:hypothetical protein
MKRCTKCGRQYSDPSLKYCTEDGTSLSPQFDSEAQTVKIAPAMSPEDLMLEIANYLRRCGIEDGLVQFEPLAKGLGVTVAEIAEQFEAAAHRLISKEDPNPRLDQAGPPTQMVVLGCCRSDALN